MNLNIKFIHTVRYLLIIGTQVHPLRKCSTKNVNVQFRTHTKHRLMFITNWQTVHKCQQVYIDFGFRSNCIPTEN